MQSKNDNCLFIKHSGSTKTYLLVYVDDILIVGNDKDDIQHVKDYLNDQFSIKDLGNAKYFLGVEISKNSSDLFLNQRKYTLDILNDTGMVGCKPANTPLPTGISLTDMNNELYTNISEYRRLIGRLLYMNITRPDLTYVVQQLSQYVKSPTSAHWDATMHLVRYLKGTITTRMHLPSTSNFRLYTYCDASWASCSQTKKSVTGYYIFLGNSLVSWKTKKHATNYIQIKCRGGIQSNGLNYLRNIMDKLPSSRL